MNSLNQFYICYDNYQGKLVNRNFIKNIIDQELNDIVDETKSLYIFDFDDTLVTDNAIVYVIQPSNNNNKIPLSYTEYHHYQLKDDEYMDFGEFEEINNPTIHENIMRLLVRHLQNSAILTARSKSGPIKNYLKSIGIDVPEVIAIGSRSQANILVNAKRKKDWIEKAIQSRNLEHVEFWDDNLQNVFQAKKLIKKYPDVRIIIHRVKHSL